MVPRYRLGILLVIFMTVLSSTSYLQVFAGVGIGGRPSVNPESVRAGQALAPIVLEQGKVSLSLDALGITGNSGNIYVEKPAGATVRKAYIAAATTGFTNWQLQNGDIKIEGYDVIWNQAIQNSVSSYNYLSDVTSIVKPIIDSYGASSIGLNIYENNSSFIEGEILAVIFDDPNQIADNTISLMFGSQNVNGDSFSINLTSPIDLQISDTVLNLSLGISYGCQGNEYCGGGPSAQYSQITVNGKRLTTSAGGHDDGELQNGALITVGGLGDTNTNPADPGAYPINELSDDELYDLIPYINEGDKIIKVDTLNPSNDDNIFFAALFMGGAQATVVFPFLDLPINYQYTNFSFAALGSNNGSGTGRVNSWFDHQKPTYSTDSYIKTWTGGGYQDLPDVQCTFGVNCYDGHNGIDFRIRDKNTSEPVVAAATGKVVFVNKAWPTSKCPQGSGYGNCVMIEHTGTKYATLYGHMDPVASEIVSGTIVTEGQELGGIGNTGRSTGPHLHFGVYYDANGNGKWEETEVVDPYGWDAWRESDPWSMTSAYLWVHKLVNQSLLTPAGNTITSQSNTKTVVIPMNAVSSTINVELWEVPPVAEPSAQLRSTGDSFWLKVLEWLVNPSQKAAARVTNSFSLPVQLSMNYSESNLDHLDESKLTIYHWDETQQKWIGLPTTVDMGQKVAQAETSEAGNYDLQAPLLCPADTQEFNDNFYGAKLLKPNQPQISNLFDIQTDEDWFQLETINSGFYTIRTSNLGTQVDTLLEIYDTNINLLLSEDSNGGEKASLLEWQAPTTGIYFIRVTQTNNSIPGCSAGYDLQVAQSFQLYLTMIRH